MLTDSRLILSRLKKEGWELVRTRGSHHVFRHATSGALVVVPHPKKDLPIGTAKSIYQAVGWPIT